MAKKLVVDVRERMSNIANMLIEHNSHAYAAGYLTSAMIEVIEMLPIRKQKEFLEKMRNTIRENTMVEVENMMSGAKVKISLKDRGTCLDPSTERYWTM